MSGWIKHLGRKLVPDFLLKDYTPYDCKVSAIKENYDLKARIMHAKNLIKTAVNLKRLPFPAIQCKNCLFDTRVPNIYITSEGICNMCAAYRKNFDPETLKVELRQFLDKPKQPGAQYDAIVAFSGGKDSTVSLAITVWDYKLKVMAVLVDNGFIPDFVIQNGQEICDSLKVPLRIEKIDFAPKIEELLKHKFATGYPCNVCTVLFHEKLTEVCVETQVNRVILGRNWWRFLDPKVKAVRSVKPAGVNWDIEFMSLPFALQMKESAQKQILDKIGWKPREIHGDSTNCLVPGLVEKIVFDRIGYHPELNLLSREVIVGFQSKEKALKKITTVRDLSADLTKILDSKKGTGK